MLRDLQGPTSTFCVGDVSAASALDYAWRVIRDGRADVVLAGGVEALSLPLLAYLGLNPPVWTPGEGAAFFVLESASHLLARGGPSLGELLWCRLEDEAPEGEKSPDGPRPYGHTFGASMALDLAATLLTEGLAECSLSRRDPTGLSATVSVRRA